MEFKWVVNKAQVADQIASQLAKKASEPALPWPQFVETE
jgi:hypothetical protein